jgi:hypothetical protein
VEILIWTDVEGKMSPWCQQLFLGKEKEHYSPWLMTPFGTMWTSCSLPFSMFKALDLIPCITGGKRKTTTLHWRGCYETCDRQNNDHYPP